MKIKISTKYKIEVGEINELESQTVPDQSLTIEEMLIRHTRGIEIGLTETRVPFYDENFNYNIKSLDLTEIDMLRENLRNSYKDGERKLKEFEEFEEKLNSRERELKHKKTVPTED